MEPIKPVALRATEQLWRVAGVLSVFAGETEINLETARNAAELVTYSLDTWQGIFGDRERAEARNWACKLYAWLSNQPERRASETAMLRIGPKPLRSKARRDTALAVLEADGRIERTFEYWTVCHD